MYIVNSCVNLASVGVELDGCDGFFIKKLIGCCYSAMFDINDCENGMIEGCLQNGNNIPRNGFADTDIPELMNWLTEDKLFDYLFIPILRKECEFIKLSDSTGITVYNTFIYGGNCFVNAVNSEALFVNVASDGSSKDKCMLNFTGGEATVINSMRSTSDGKDGNNSYETDGTTVLRLYNRQAVDLMYREYTVEENIGTGADSPFDIFAFMIKLYTVLGKLATILEQM